MRVGYFSPLPPERTGIADYSALLLPELEQRLDLVVARRGRRGLRWRADLNVYHIGNNPAAHAWIVEALRRTPGLVVLHDFVLHHLVAGMTLGRGDAHGYVDAMHREAGVSGRLIAHGVVDGVVASPWEVCPERFPLVGEIFPYALGIVVHSRYVEDRLREAGYLGPVWRVAMPAWPRPDPVARAASAAAGVADGAVAGGTDGGRARAAGLALLSFGNLTPGKRVPELLRAFEELRRDVPGARLVLAGPESPELDLGGKIGELGLDGAVERLGWVDERRLWTLIEDADVCVALRYPTMGETSSIVLRALSAGLPLVVSDEGWYAELPDSVAVKVGVDAWEHETLVATLRLLAARPDVRRTMAREAKALASREHAVDRVADAYLAAIEEMAGGELVRVEVTRDVARAAADVGLDPADPSVAALGRHLRELGL